MKRFLVFIGGFVAGVVATILIGYIIVIANKPNDGLIGLTLFSEKGECITTDGEIEIFQVLAPNMALARTGDILDGIVVLLISKDGTNYYDEQKIKIPSKKCVRQIGTYQYTTKKDGFEKTVPAVTIEEKNLSLEEKLKGRKTKGTQDSDSKGKKMQLEKSKEYFTIGSTEDEVISVMGDPESFHDMGSAGKLFMYGGSSITFEKGRVKSYQNLGGNLKVKVK
jgi:hypothetical protein